jgi:anthranilate phosphoribosyltransferase
LNISTAVALVVAGCGVPVAKHGNRAMSSKCGAADVLEALGLKLTGDAPTLERALREANVAFLFAQNHHPAMRHVAAARRELGHRTIFNLLGPLSNPASVKRQLVGVFDPALMRPIAEALRLLGAERAMVLHGAGGLDELSFAPEGQSRSVILDQDNSVQEVSMDQRQDSQMYEVPLTPISALAGGSAHANAAALRALLESRAPNSAYESAVLLNAVQALCLADKAETGWDAWDLAKRSIRDGRALAALERLVEITQAAP